MWKKSKPHNNIEFVNDEKVRLIGIKKIRKGVLAFLTAKGALYKSWGHHDADIWINKAKEIEPSIEIPGSLDGISEVMESCLSFYAIENTEEQMLH